MLIVIGIVNALLLGILVWDFERLSSFISAWTLKQDEARTAAKIHQQQNEDDLEEEDENRGLVITWSPEVARERNSRLFERRTP